MKFGSGFFASLDGVNLNGSLLAKVQRMCQWAIQNDMVTEDIEIGGAMRSPAMAHQMCVAWELQYRYGKYLTFDDVRALPQGKDADGNNWTQYGTSDQDILKKCNEVRSSSAKAAAGYMEGNPKRAPLDDGPGVSNHCSGGAIDVTIHWRAPGQDASKNADDVWAWENIYNMFGIFRALPKGSKYQENWHVEESGKQLNTDDQAPPEPSAV